jgi:uncharacterized protein (DUF58 family)
MLSIPEILKKVRQIEIRTKGLTQNLFNGEYHSAFKGQGMSFNEIRAYTYGDDVRFIDWNVTARSQAPYIKVFEEERELNVLIVVDVSASNLFGNQSTTKQALITEIAAIIAFAATQNNDKVALILFNQGIVKYCPAKKGKSHILRLIRELVAAEPQNTTTNITQVLEFINLICKKKSIVFLLSDFISPNYQKALQATAKKHDLIGIHIHTPPENAFPNLGFVHLQDAENKTLQATQTTKQTQTNFATHQHTVTQLLKSSGAATLSISTQQDYIRILELFFKKRI